MKPREPRIRRVTFASERRNLFPPRGYGDESVHAVDICCAYNAVYKVFRHVVISNDSILVFTETSKILTLLRGSLRRTGPRNGAANHTNLP
jgi:hypothetical protein